VAGGVGTCTEACAGGVAGSALLEGKIATTTPATLTIADRAEARGVGMMPRLLNIQTMMITRAASRIVMVRSVLLESHLRFCPCSCVDSMPHPSLAALSTFVGL